MVDKINFGKTPEELKHGLFEAGTIVAAQMITVAHNERRRYGYALTDRDRQWLVSIHNICTLTDCECGHYHIFESTP